MKTATRALVVLLGVVAASVGIWSCNGSLEEERFEDRVDELRAAGALVDGSQLATPPIPDVENAAPLLLEANAWYEANRDSEPEFPKFLEEPSPEVREWVGELGPYFALLERAAARPKCRFEIDWSVPHAAQIRSPQIIAFDAMRALWWRVRLGGRPSEQLMRDCETGWRLCGFLERCSPLLGMVHWSGRMVVAMALESIAPHADPEELRARFEPRLAAVEDSTRLHDVIRGERVYLIAYVRDLASGGESWMNSRPPYPGLGKLRGPLGRSVMGVVARPEVYREGLRALERHDLLLAALRDGLSAASVYAEREHASLASEEGVSGYFAGFLRGDAFVLRKYRLYLARIRVTRLGLAAGVHRAKTGRWPATLGELAPLFPDGIPLDPFGENPFRYDPGKRIASAAPDIQPIAFELP